jgi:ribonuclease Z
MEHHVRLAKLRNVFLTELRAHTLGGLPGMILTVSDAGKDALHIYGPEGTKQFMHATRFFLFRPKFQLETHDLVSPAAASSASATETKPVYADDEVRVIAIPLRARGGHKRKLNDEQLLMEGANDAVSYVVETPEQRGKFLVQKAVELGVPKGALFGQLHKGHDVTLPDGRVVRSADCVSASLPASGVAIVACPAISYVDELVSSSIFRQYQWQDDATTAPPSTQLQAVYHLASPAVLCHPPYVAWAAKFGNDVDHILLHHDACAGKTVYRSSAKLQAQLHNVFPHAFPGNDYELRDAETPFSRDVEEKELSFSSKRTVPGECMLKYVIVPLVRRGFDTTQCFSRVDFKEIETSMAPFRQQTKPLEADASIPDELNGRITFLGTGCAIPSKYRNVTGIHLQLPTADGKSNGVLLDFGEGSLGQLYRYTNGNVVELRRLVQEIKLVWVSHNHADHHLGLVRLLSFRSKSDENDEPLLIIGPPPVRSWLNEYARIDPTIAGKYTFVDHACFHENDDNFQESIATTKPIRVWLEQELEISELESVPVKHAFKSFAVVFKWKHALKICFSGDCRPSDLVAEKAKDAFLMIHEATFDDSMTAEAKQKDHSTTAEALEVGKKAHAKHVILTHFSQRYPKMPAATNVENGATTELDAMSAMDLLSLRFSDLHTQAQLMEISLQILAMDDAQDPDQDE